MLEAVRALNKLLIALCTTLGRIPVRSGVSRDRSEGEMPGN